MAQDFRDIPASQAKRDSRPRIVERDEALRSEFSGSSAPSDPEAVDGQRHFNTTSLLAYQRRNGAWVPIADQPPAESVDALRGFSYTSGVPTGTKCFVLGYEALGDCSPFLVRWDATSSAAHDGINVFRPSAGPSASGNGRWLICSEADEIERYGVIANDGTTDERAAIVAAIAAAVAAGKTYMRARRSYAMDGAPIEIPRGFTFDVSGSTWYPLDTDVTLFRGHGGSKIIGRMTISRPTNWAASVVLYDGASEASASTSFRLPQGTYINLEVLGGATTGAGGGNCVHIRTIDDTVNNRWVLGIHGVVRYQGFERALYLQRTGGDSLRTFIADVTLKLIGGYALQTLVCDDDDPYGINGIEISGRVQSRDTAEQTATAIVIEGQNHKIALFQDDWVGGSGGTVKGLSIASGARANKIEVQGIAPALVEDNSLITDNNDIYVRHHTGQYRKVSGYRFADDPALYGGQAYRTLLKSRATANREHDMVDADGLLPVHRASAPASRTASAKKGELHCDTNYLHFARADNTWERVSTSAPRVVHVPAAAQITGDTNNHVVGTVTVAAGELGLNGFIEVEMWCSHNNSGNAKNERCKFGGQTLIGAAPSASVAFRAQTSVRNQNAANAQIAVGNAFAPNSQFGSLGTDFQTFAIDTSVAQDITFEIQLANSGDNATFRGATVKIYHAD